MDASALAFVPRLLRVGIYVPAEKTSEARAPRPLILRLEVLFEVPPAGRGPMAAFPVPIDGRVAAVVLGSRAFPITVADELEPGNVEAQPPGYLQRSSPLGMPDLRKCCPGSISTQASGSVGPRCRTSGSRRASEPAWAIVLGVDLGEEASSRGIRYEGGVGQPLTRGKVERALASEQFGPWMEPHTCIPIPRAE